jgi:ribosomal protein L11 methyltransferase
LGKAWPALSIQALDSDPQLQELVLAALDDFQPTAIQETDQPSCFQAFFASHQSRDAAAIAAAASFDGLLAVVSLDVEDEDWAARSQSQLRAISVGCLIVAPPWDMGSDPMSKIVIQPSMGFGTGHHATTRLTLLALQTLPVDGRTVLDIGCGSGVLAIAALRLGARSAVGIDIDPDAVANATEVSTSTVCPGRARIGDFRVVSSPAHIVMANLTGDMLERSVPRLAELVEPGGYLIVSGFMTNESESVLKALQASFRLQRTTHEDEWMCAVLDRPSLEDGQAED